MAKHKPGQVTWPDLSSRHWCSECGLFSQDGLKPSRELAGYGRCIKTRQVSGKDGVQFIGKDARACPKFEGKT